MVLMSELSETSATTPGSPQLVDRPRIEAVLFDYGQVLSQGPNADAWERMRAVAGGSSEIFHAAYWKFRHEYDRGTLSGTAYWHKVAEAAEHAGLREGEIATLYQADVDLWADLNGPMVAWAKELHRRGIRTGILSNIGDQMETGIRKRFAWLEDFHHCTWSHQLKLAKPETAIYRHAAEGLKTAPEHILFIDDREENIAAARVAGMIAVQYTTHDTFIEEMRWLGLEWLLRQS